MGEVTLKNNNTPGKAALSGKKGDLLSILFLALLTLLFFGRVVFYGRVLLPLDMVFSAEPWQSESPDPSTRPAWNPEITDAIWQF